MKKLPADINHKREGGPAKRGRPKKQRTMADLAKIAGISRDTLYRARFIQQYGDKETLAAIERGAVSVNKVYIKLRREYNAQAFRAAMDAANYCQNSDNKDGEGKE